LNFTSSVFCLPFSLSGPGKGYSRIQVLGKAQLHKGSKIQVCIERQQEPGTEIQVLEFEEREGEFEIEFSCSENSRRRHHFTRDLEELEAIQACSPTSKYTATGFALLFSPCAGGKSSTGDVIWILCTAFAGGITVFVILIAILHEVHPPFKNYIRGVKGASLDQVVEKLQRHRLASSASLTPRVVMPLPNPTPPLEKV
jgi:hypothetical protein